MNRKATILPILFAAAYCNLARGQRRRINPVWNCMKYLSNICAVVFPRSEAHRVKARLLTMFILLAAGSCAEESFGIWKMNAARSTSTGRTQPKSFTVRIDAHPKGEVFTLELIEPDGRMTTSSSVLYFDAVPREFQDFECSGTQSSRRMDRQTVEVLRNCGSDAWTRFVRRTAAKQNELVLEISEQHADGRRFERRLVLEKK